MLEKLESVFKKYEGLVKQVDDVFKRVQEQYTDCVKCKLECSDCCYALFDLSFIEALYINQKYIDTVDSQKRSDITEGANTADRKIYQLKRNAFKSVESGKKTEDQVLFEIAAERVKCPLLNTQNKCELYKYRPITCRLYGIPTSFAGKGHTCGLSDFKEGVSYPTVNLDSIHTKLYELSQEAVAALKSKHIKMGDMLMPLSMAVLTVFDDEYLGIGDGKIDQEENKA